MSNLVKITDQNFEDEVIQSDKGFLLDFSAEWCGPCKALAPVLENIAQEEDNVRIGKIDIDQNPSIATRFQIRSVPTMIFFRGGEIKGQLSGNHPKEKIRELILS